MLRYLSCLLISISFFYCSGKNQDKILSDIITTLNSSDVYLRIYNQEMTYYEIKMDIGDVNVLSSYINGAKKQIAKIPAYYWIECKKDGQTVVSIGISEDCKGFKYNGASFIIDDDKSLELNKQLKERQQRNDSISSFRDSDKINYRFNDLNQLGIDSILIELNYPKYGEIFLSAQNSYYQKNDIFGDKLYPKYEIDKDSWKILINGINKFVVLKEPFLIKKVKRPDGLIAAVDYFARLNICIYIGNNVLSSEIEKTEEVGRYMYIYTDDFKKWYEYIYNLLYY